MLLNRDDHKSPFMNQIQARIANDKDIEYIALLGRVTFTETFGHLFRDKRDLLTYCHKTFSVEKIAQSIAKPHTHFWIAFVNRLPVGYAKLKLKSPSEFIDSKNTSQLQKIYVLQDFLSMNIGFELQRQLLEKARKEKSETIWLSVLKENLRATKFYLKHGFVEVGEHGFQIGKEHFDFTVMSKIL